MSIQSKNITLPDDSAVLTAYAIPKAAADSEDGYSYEWSLVTSTAAAGDGTMENANKQQLKLSNLKEGTM